MKKNELKLTFVGDKTPELEAEVESDPHNGNRDEPDDITTISLNNDKNTDNVFEQPKLNFEVDKISEIASKKNTLYTDHFYTSPTLASYF